MEGVPKDLWEAAKLAGPFGTLLMLAMWWLERADRVRLQRERDALLERVLTTLGAAGSSLQDIKGMLASWVTRRE